MVVWLARAAWAAFRVKQYRDQKREEETRRLADEMAYVKFGVTLTEIIEQSRDQEATAKLRRYGLNPDGTPLRD